MKFFSRLKKDIRVVFERDPAAKSTLEVILCYSGLHAIWLHRISHALFKRGWIVSARLVSNFCRLLTGIEIHPGATIGDGLFIDHGTGIVIGETAEIGKNVTLYQGVTLGGTGKEKGKRHPTIGNNVVVATGAKVLGSFKVGDHAKIGAGSVVLKEVPPYATVVGIPGRIVVLHGRRIHNEDDYREAWLSFCEKNGMNVKDPQVHDEICDEIDVDLDHDLLPDPDREVIEVALRQIQRLEERVSRLEAELAAARAEITDEAIRTSELEVVVVGDKLSKLKHERKNKNDSSLQHDD
ncbi:MAG: serine O-acetyltransferase [Selenomonadaceae bacterium]|nr:serine O-acetyltransferase [Selenomonadaceae bacterium]